MNMGDYRAAIVEFDKFIRLEPNNPYAYHNRGIAKDQQQQHEAAIVDFDEAIRLKTDFAIAYSSRGTAKMNLEQGQTAIADYDMAIRLDPNLIVAYYNRGVANGETGQYDAAIADFSEIIRLQPDFAASSHPPLWSLDSQHLFCVAQGHLWCIDVVSRNIEKLTDGFDRRVVRLVRQAEADTVWSPDDTESVSVQTLRRAEHGFHRINLKTRKITKLVEETRVYNRKGNMDVAPQTGDIFYSVEDISHPSEMWIADADFQNPRQLTRLNSGIEKASLGTSQSITWQTPAGKQLRGALLFPADYVEGQSYPLITQVYGGSFLSHRGNDFGTDGTGHNFLLTKQGYVVFLPDMPMETNAPIQELTECVLSGIDAVVDMGIADAKRLGVMGHSYGGYCVNALITQTSRFAAAVSSAPVSDLISCYGYLTEGGDSPWITWAERSQGKMGGSLWEFRERYIENSPSFSLTRWKHPYY